METEPPTAEDETIHVRCEKRLKMKAKVAAVLQDENLSDYIRELIREDTDHITDELLEKHSPDYGGDDAG